MIFVFAAILVFVSALVQSLSGFGFALLLMPLVTLAIGLKTGAPLVALLGLILNTINFFRYRQSVDGPELVRLTLASALGVPVGIWALANVSEGFIVRLMGLILIAYAVYSLTRPAMPQLAADKWVYPAGFVAGGLGAAYNTPGPPLIIYASLRQFPKDEFRGMLYGLFCLNGVMVVVSHFLAKNVTGAVLDYLPATLPALLLAILVASRMDVKLDQARFRTLVLGLILLLGLAMILDLGR